MFTGIIEELGIVEAIEPRSTGSRLRVRAPLVCSDTKEGDSICVSGVCLTAVDLKPGSFGADVSPETLTRTSLRLAKVGAPVNLERALLPTTRLGGHIVQGHVDGVGEIVGVRDEGETRLVDFTLPPDVDAVTILHGSITLNGVSLTVNALPAPGRCQVALIPHTRAVTTLGDLRAGDPVNVEGDLIGKYVGRIVASVPRRPAGAHPPDPGFLP